jgi:hypothetical protein
MSLLEKSVRSRYIGDMPAYVGSESDKKWKYRADQEWEVAKLALETAQRLKQPIFFERTKVSFHGRSMPDTLYRVRIVKPLVSRAIQATFGRLGFVERGARVYGWMPEYYLGASVETMRPGQRGPDLFQAGDSMSLVAQTEFVVIAGIAYGVTVELKNLRLTEFLEGHAAIPFLFPRDTCGFQYQSNSTINKKGTP